MKETPPEHYIYELIKHLRKAEEEFFEEHGLDGAFYCVDLTVYDMDSTFTQPLKKVVDQDAGYEFKR